MRAKLIVVCVLGAVLQLSSRAESGRHKVPDSADNKEAILAWGKALGGYFRSSEYKCNENEALVLLIDRASGVYADEIYVYGRDLKRKTSWYLLQFRRTGVRVTVQENHGKLIFRSAAGKVILEQTLEMIGEMVQKKMEEAKKRESTVPVQKNLTPKPQDQQTPHDAP